MSTVIFWFRQDLRLHDQQALHAATAIASHLVPVFCHAAPEEMSEWGFARVGNLRRQWLASALTDLRNQLRDLNCPLIECHRPASESLPALAAYFQTKTIVCEEIAAPDEQQQIEMLRKAGLHVLTIWQSTIYDPSSLPFDIACLPDVFTPFRQKIMAAQIKPGQTLAAPSSLPGWPVCRPIPSELQMTIRVGDTDNSKGDIASDLRSSVPRRGKHINGGEHSALAHMEDYFSGPLLRHYKQTRNQLSGADFSSKLSLWLATGALSVRQIVASLQEHEMKHGVSEGSGWLWLEFLWRDYFRFLHLKYGKKLYAARGLKQHSLHTNVSQSFECWREGKTGEPLIDAAMNELRTSGYLSNRLRQIVASYLIHNLQQDWRAGAAWFESCLLDYDVYSNQGNWLYIAGLGTDPRGGRHFDVRKQLREFDPDAQYCRLWGGL